MAFSAGTDAKVYANGVDISTFLRSASVSGSRDMLDSTTLGLNDRAFVPGLRNATLNMEGFFDGSPDAIDEIIAAALASSDGIIVTFLPYGDGLGNRGFGMEGDVSGYDPVSPVDNLTTFSANVQSSVGSEPVQALHALAEVTATANGTGVDQAAQSTDGGTAYLQVTAMDRTTGDETMVVKVQDSADDITYADLITFVTPTEPGAQYLTVTGTVDRYVRAQHTLAGTTPSASYSLAFHRN